MMTRIEKHIELFELVGRSNEMRPFACWVARQTNFAGSDDRKIVDDISHRSKFPDYIDKYCERLMERQRSKAGAAMAVGLGHGCLNAREYLCAISCAYPEHKEAVLRTIGHAALWYQQVTGMEDAEPFLELIADKLDAVWAKRDGL